MEVGRIFMEGLYRHGRMLLDRGTFDCRDVKTANALRLMRADIKKLERILKNDNDRKKPDKA